MERQRPKMLLGRVDVSGLFLQPNAARRVRLASPCSYTNHIKYLISSEPHMHFNPRRIDAEMVIPF